MWIQIIYYYKYLLKQSSLQYHLHLIQSNKYTLHNITYPLGEHMESKNGKQYLPQTFQQFQALRKKTQKVANIVVKAVSSVNHGMFSYSHMQGQNYGIAEELPKNLASPTQIKVYQQAEDKGDTDGNTGKEGVQLVEKTVYSDYQKMFDQFLGSKFPILSQKFQIQLQRLTVQPPLCPISINGILKDLSIQSLQNLKNLEYEFRISQGRRNVQKIDTMLGFNKFFVILNKQKRVRIYENCQFITVEEGEQIYRDGDVEDYMYVVVKGCVKQYEKKSTSYHEKIMVNFVSHYEGSNFGQAQLVGEKNQKAKRHHTAIAAQKSYLLKISNQFYRDLITNSAEDDFEKKISALLSTSMFSQTSKIFVTPLLSTLEKKTLNFGQVLIKQGDPVKKLYFIGQGNLQIVYISRDRRSIKHLNIEQKPKNFKTKIQPSSSFSSSSQAHAIKSKSQKKQRQKNYSIHHTFYYSKQQQFDSNKQFVYGKKKVIGDQLEYNDQIVFEQLRNGNFLGGKSFLTIEQREKKAEQSMYFYEELEAKLTVIASTLFTTVYSIDEKKFFSLSDNLQKVIIDGIIGSPYFDELDIQKKVSKHQKDKKYSENLVAKIIKQKKQRNQSFRN